MLKIVNFIYLCTILTIVSSEVSNQDSYLNALQNSHQSNNNGASERVADVSFHASSGYEYPPVPEYGPPPAPVYGPPAPKPIYGPPPHPSHIYINHPPPFFHHHHHPREETCEDMMEDASSAESRDFGTDKEKLNETINEVTKFAKTAMETFSRKYEGCERDQIWCRFQRTVDVIDKKYPYEKIVQLYSPKREVKA